MAVRTLDRKRSNSIALMTDQSLHRTRMICKSNIAMWALLELSTVSTHPGTSCTTTVIKEKGFLAYLLVLADYREDLARYERGLYG
jgi:hypothetical protein